MATPTVDRLYALDTDPNVAEFKQLLTDALGIYSTYRNFENVWDDFQLVSLWHMVDTLRHIQNGLYPYFVNKDGEEKTIRTIPEFVNACRKAFSKKKKIKLAVTGEAASALVTPLPPEKGNFLPTNKPDFYLQAMKKMENGASLLAILAVEFGIINDTTELDCTYGPSPKDRMKAMSAELDKLIAHHAFAPEYGITIETSFQESLKELSARYPLKTPVEIKKDTLVQGVTQSCVWFLALCVAAKNDGFELAYADKHGKKAEALHLFDGGIEPVHKYSYNRKWSIPLPFYDATSPFYSIAKKFNYPPTDTFPAEPTLPTASPTNVVNLFPTFDKK